MSTTKQRWPSYWVFRDPPGQYHVHDLQMTDDPTEARVFVGTQLGEAYRLHRIFEAMAEQYTLVPCDQDGPIPEAELAPLPFQPGDEVVLTREHCRSVYPKPELERDTAVFLGYSILPGTGLFLLTNGPGKGDTSVRPVRFWERRRPPLVVTCDGAIKVYGDGLCLRLEWDREQPADQLVYGDSEEWNPRVRSEELLPWNDLGAEERKALRNLDYRFECDEARAIGREFVEEFAGYEDEEAARAAD